MNYKEFKFELKLGREAEFSLSGKEYFISHDEIKYNIWGENEKKYICVGELDEILEFKFKDGISLKDNFEKFVIKCIL
jgi:hypothetical protein